MEESLLERCLSDLLDYYEGNMRSEEFSDPDTQIIINLFNSSCLFCSRDVSKNIIQRYPQWSKAMAKEIDIYEADNPLLRQKEKRLSLSPKKTIKKAGSKKKSKKKRKTKRSSKKKSKNKRTKRSSKKEKKKKKIF